MKKEGPILKNQICQIEKINKSIEIKQNEAYIDGEKLKQLGFGVDGVVYRYFDYAIKIYHKTSIKRHLSKEERLKLEKLNYKHIVLPKLELISDASSNPGYVMPYIDIERKKDILLEPTKQVINELKELEEEVIDIGEKGYVFTDLQCDNYFYNGIFYVLDPDGFMYFEKRDVSPFNLELLKESFMKEMVLNRKRFSLTRGQIYYYYKLFLQEYAKSNVIPLNEFFKETVETPNLLEYSYQLQKKR